MHVNTALFTPRTVELHTLPEGAVFRTDGSMGPVYMRAQTTVYMQLNGAKCSTRPQCCVDCVRLRDGFVTLMHETTLVVHFPHATVTPDGAHLGPQAPGL